MSVIRATWTSAIINGLAILGLCYIAYDAYFAPTPPGPTPQEKRQQAAGQRQAAGVRVASTAQIGQHETLRVIAFPDPLLPDVPELDHQCALYTHAEWQIASFGCPPGDAPLSAER